MGVSGEDEVWEGKRTSCRTSRSHEMHKGAAFLGQVIVSLHGWVLCILGSLFIPVGDAAERMSILRDVCTVGRHTHKHDDVITHLQMYSAKVTPAQSQLRYTQSL